MSDTPRTDRLAVTWELKGVSSKVVDMESCQLLERELNRVTAERDTLKQQLDSYFADRAKSPWKSVDEPPKKRGEYLAVDKNGRYDVCFYENGEWNDGHGYEIDVTHWTEIPELCL